MKELQITTPIVVMQYDELDPTDRSLVDAAREATFRAYSPYSHFSVGAAILLDNGETVTGSNQENAAYPSSLCAERTAAYYAHSRYPDAKFMTIAIAARGGQDHQSLRGGSAVSDRPGGQDSAGR